MTAKAHPTPESLIAKPTSAARLKCKPCPWCGAIPYIGFGKKGSCQLHGEPYQAILVHCKTSGCPAKPSVQAGDIYNGGRDKAEAQAIKLWNSQHESDTAAELERVRAEVAELVSSLNDCREFIDKYSDVVDGNYGEPHPNQAMQLVGMIDTLVAKHTTIDEVVLQDAYAVCAEQYSKDVNERNGARLVLAEELRSANVRAVYPWEKLSPSCQKDWLESADIVLAKMSAKHTTIDPTRTAVIAEPGKEERYQLRSLTTEEVQP